MFAVLRQAWDAVKGRDDNETERPPGRLGVLRNGRRNLSKLIAVFGGRLEAAVLRHHCGQRDAKGAGLAGPGRLML